MNEFLNLKNLVRKKYLNYGKIVLIRKKITFYRKKLLMGLNNDARMGKMSSISSGLPLRLCLKEMLQIIVNSNYEEFQSKLVNKILNNTRTLRLNKFLKLKSVDVGDLCSELKNFISSIQVNDLINPYLIQIK
ncbi:hypothetical protein BpHYR1_013790 [Brachionus plicatilis]|uniref:Uncharacterized protein n=1 Tax=Brachionus plicatilis TaxID=10195 RepID=A0A3M7S7H2_BRAPC|nr:hypothetical protein BpHYR1_013790 [Brachionus plicatilis]